MRSWAVRLVQGWVCCLLLSISILANAQVGCNLLVDQMEMFENDTFQFELGILLDLENIRYQDGLPYSVFVYDVTRSDALFPLEVNNPIVEKAQCVGPKDVSGKRTMQVSWWVPSGEWSSRCLDTFYMQVKRVEDSRYDSIGLSDGLKAIFKNTGTPFTDKHRSGLLVGEHRIPLIWTSGLWMGGLDIVGNVHASWEIYDFKTTDRPPERGYVPGLNWVDSQKVYEYDDHLWKVSKRDIEDHIRGFPISEEVETWPGQRIKYDPFLEKASSQAKAPCLFGDEMVYGNFTDLNDSFRFRSEADWVEVDVRFKASSFQNSTSEALNNTIFLSYYIENVSGIDYDSFSVGLFTDFSVGSQFNNFVGCDTLLQSFYAYNATHTEPLFNESESPAVGITFLNRDMDAFVAYNGGFGRMGDPSFKKDFYDLLRGRLKDGKKLWYGGKDGELDRWQSNRRTTYSYPGDLADTSRPNWTEYTAGTVAGNRRGVGSMAPVYFGAGDTIILDIAVVAGLKEGNDSFENVTLLKEHIKEVRNYYAATGFECYNPVDFWIKDETDVEVFPNPFKDYLNIHSPKSGIYELFDLTGRKLQNGDLAEGINHIGLSSEIHYGTYILEVSTALGKTGHVLFRSKL